MFLYTICLHAIFAGGHYYPRQFSAHVIMFLFIHVWLKFYVLQILGLITHWFEFVRTKQCCVSTYLISRSCYFSACTMSLPPTSVGGFAHSGAAASDVPMNQAPTQGIVTEAVRALNAATIGITAGDRGRSARSSRARQAVDKWWSRHVWQAQHQALV